MGPAFGRVRAALCRAKLAKTVATVKIDMSLSQIDVTTMKLAIWMNGHT